MKFPHLKLCISLIFLTFKTSIFSQNRLIEVTCDKEVNSTGYVFMCKNNSPVDYTVEIQFSSLINLTADGTLPFKGTVHPGTSRLFGLKPSNQGAATDVSFTYFFYKGCIKANPQTDFTYILPIQANKTTEPFELTNIGEYYGKETPPKDWYVLGFKMTEGDTIYASRKGVVGEIEKSQKDPKGDNVSFTQNVNYIEIQQEDCTFARYELFKENGIFVKVGDKVQAGQPLGIVSGKNYIGGSHVRLSVFYAHIEPILKDGKDTGKKYYSAYVPIQFWVDSKLQKLEKGKTYTSEHPEIIVTKEMTKKEKKKWLEGAKK